MEQQNYLFYVETDNVIIVEDCPSACSVSNLAVWNKL